MRRPEVPTIPADRILHAPPSPLGTNLKLAFDSPTTRSIELDALVNLIDRIR